MYVDQDANGRYQLADLTPEECATIERALAAYRAGLVPRFKADKERPMTECEQQYITAGRILTHMQHR